MKQTTAQKAIQTMIKAGLKKIKFSDMQKVFENEKIKDELKIIFDMTEKDTTINFFDAEKVLKANNFFSFIEIEIEKIEQMKQIGNYLQISIQLDKEKEKVITNVYFINYKKQN